MKYRLLIVLMTGLFAASAAAQNAVPRNPYPNEPEGYVPWFSHDWQSFPDTDASQFPMPASEAGYMHRLGNFGGFDNIELIDDPDAPHGLGKSLRMKLPEGFGTGSGIFSWSFMAHGAGHRNEVHAETELAEVYFSVWMLWEGDEDGKAELPWNWRFWSLNRHIPDSTRFQRAQFGTAVIVHPSGFLQDKWDGIWTWGPRVSDEPGGGATLVATTGPGPKVGEWFHVEGQLQRLGWAPGNWPVDGQSQWRLWVDGEKIVDEVIAHAWTIPLRQFFINTNVNAHTWIGKDFEGEVLGMGDGVNKRFTGNLANVRSLGWLRTTTLRIAAGEQAVGGASGGRITGDVDPDGANTVNYRDGSFDFTFAEAPAAGVPVLASYTQNVKSRDDYMRYSGWYISGVPFREQPN